jgi:glycosyltransferase involved in cell wall biosynthesis
VRGTVSAMRIGYLISHPTQYYVPIFRALAQQCDLTVFYGHRQTPEQQARSGFEVPFDWDIDLLSGYRYKFLENVAQRPSTDHFSGCNTPGIGREIAEGKFDAFFVPGWFLHCYWQAVWACRRTRTPVLVRGDSQLAKTRSTATALAKAVAFPLLLRFFDGYLYVGERHREYLAHYGAPAGRTFFSPHCVDNDGFRDASDAARQAAPAGRSSEVRRLLFVGKLIERKRPLDLIRAAAWLCRNGVPVEVAFAGSGELRPSLEAAAKAEELPVHFLGFVNQSELPAIYASSDVLVLPSDALETWGLVVNEAMACGVPAVVSDEVGCSPDLVETGATGGTYPVGDVQALAKSIKSVLALPREATRRNIAVRMQIYSPKRAAQGIIEAAAATRPGPDSKA